ncbi:MAG: hypothetical protein ACRDV9_00405 [Acidimicrobiia bacterium]
MNWNRTLLAAAFLATGPIALIPAQAAVGSGPSDVPAGIAESTDPAPLELVVEVPGVEVTLPDGHVVVMSESSQPVEGSFVVGPPSAGERCFPSKEEYLDAWDATGEPPSPVFCNPSSP